MNICAIHVGLPKTATTLLQAHLFPRHSQIAYLGKYIEGGSKFRDDAVRTVIMSTTRGDVFNADVDRCRRVFSRGILPTLGANRVPLWSNEGLTAGGQLRRRARAENLRAVFGDCRVIITLRHPVRFVESMYLQKLKTAHHRSEWRIGVAPRCFTIDEWLRRQWRHPEKGALSHLDYARTIEILADVFGRDALGVFLFEQLVEDAERFVGSLCRFLGVDAKEGAALTAGKRANDRLTLAQLDGIRAAEKSLLWSTVYRFAPKRVRTWIIGRQKANGKEPVRARVSPPWRQRIGEVTRRGNRWLEDQWNLPLDRYGYPL